VFFARQVGLVDRAAMSLRSLGVAHYHHADVARSQSSTTKEFCCFDFEINPGIEIKSPDPVSGVPRENETGLWHFIDDASH
jgi:hypothetical protein